MFVLPVQEKEEKNSLYSLKRRKIVISLSIFFAVAILLIVFAFVQSIRQPKKESLLPLLPKATFNKKTGQPKVKNLIANGDFSPEPPSLFGKIISKVIPPKPDRPPPGWEFYREDVNSPLPEIEIATEKPYTYVKDSAIHIKTKGKGIGLTQNIAEKPPLFAQINVLVITGKVKFSLTDKDGKEIAGEETKAEETVTKNDSGEKIMEKWQSLKVDLSEKKSIALQLKIYSLEPNSEWYLTNVAVHPYMDYSSFFKEISKSKVIDSLKNCENKTGSEYEACVSKKTKLPPENWDEIGRPKLFYHGEEIKPNIGNDSRDGKDNRVMGATLGAGVINLSHVFFSNDAFYFPGVTNNILGKIRGAWKDAPITKSIGTDSFGISSFDPTITSACYLEGFWNPIRIYMPNEWCTSNELMICVVSTGSLLDGWTTWNKKVYFNLGFGSGGPFANSLIIHELGHTLGAPDADFIVVNGNSIFPRGNSKVSSEYCDVMYDTLCLHPPSPYTIGMINNTPLDDSGNWVFSFQPSELYLIDKTQNRPLTSGKYFIYPGVGGPAHSPGTILPQAYAQGDFQSGVINQNFRLDRPNVAGFIIAQDEEGNLFKGQFDLIDLSMAYFRGQNFYTVSMEPLNMIAKIVAPEEIETFDVVRLLINGDFPIFKWELSTKISENSFLLAEGNNYVNPDAQIIHHIPNELAKYSGTLDLKLEAGFYTEDFIIWKKITTISDKKLIRFRNDPQISSVELTPGEVVIRGKNFGQRDINILIIKEINHNSPMSDTHITVWDPSILKASIPTDWYAENLKFIVYRDGYSSNEFEYIAPLSTACNNKPPPNYVKFGNQCYHCEAGSSPTQTDNHLCDAEEAGICQGIQSGFNTHDSNCFVCKDGYVFAFTSPQDCLAAQYCSSDKVPPYCYFKDGKCHHCFDIGQGKFRYVGSDDKVECYAEEAGICRGQATAQFTYGNDCYTFLCKNGYVYYWTSRITCANLTPVPISTLAPTPTPFDYCSGIGVCSGSCYPGYECRVGGDNYCDCFPITTPTPPSFPTPTPTPTPTSGPTPTSRPTSTPIPTPTPTPLPQFSQCGSCSSDAWGGCTPPEECRLINDQTICRNSNKPGIPCCIRDQSCNPGFQQVCGYGDPNIGCGKCSRFWNNPPNGPWCTNWQLNCGAGKPASPRLKSPSSSTTVSGETPITLAWYAFGEGLFYKCGEALPANWSKWDDCNQAWHFASRASCIPENTSGKESGDRSCWGYVCAKGSDGINSEWRFYTVLVKDEDDNDFREVCTIHNIPNTAISGGLPADKSSCSFTPDRIGQHQWKIRAGYSVNTGGGAYIDYNESQIFNFIVSSLPQPTFTPTPAYTAQCDSCRPYTSFWLAIPDLTAGISIGQTVNLSTRGSTGHPAGITKARFRVNGGADSNWCTGGGVAIVDNWCETTLKHEAEFYVSYPVRSTGDYTVESMVFNPDLGWY